MKKLLLIAFLVLVSAGAFSWQRRHAEQLCQRGAELREQLRSSERVALDLERQNQEARARLEQNEAALHEQQTQLVTAIQQAAASSLNATTPGPLTWRDDIPYVRFSKEHLSSLTVGIIARDEASHCRLALAATTLLGVGAEELSSVNEAIRVLCDQYLALELAHAPTNPKTERALVGFETLFAIPRLATEGADLKRTFTMALTNALGATRTDLILHYGRDVFWRQLAGFGENTKTISFTAQLDQHGQEYIKVYANFQGPQNGGYTFKLSSDDPNSALARALWERAQTAQK